jgi:hypothetical protein
MLSWMAASAGANGRRTALPCAGGSLDDELEDELEAGDADGCDASTGGVELLDEELEDELDELGADAITVSGGRILSYPDPPSMSICIPRHAFG